jgi:hypothetical protein
MGRRKGGRGWRGSRKECASHLVHLACTRQGAAQGEEEEQGLTAHARARDVSGGGLRGGP